MAKPGCEVHLKYIASVILCLTPWCIFGLYRFCNSRIVQVDRKITIKENVNKKSSVVKEIDPIIPLNFGIPKPRNVYCVDAIVTAYCPCPICCGKYSDGVTSTGRSAYLPGCAVAPSLISYGSIIEIPGLGSFVADDTGAALRKNAEKGIYHVDIRFKQHEDAVRFGRKTIKIRIRRP